MKLVEKLKKPSSAHAHLLGKMFPSSSSSTAITLHAKRSATFDPTEDGLSDFSKQKKKRFRSKPSNVTVVAMENFKTNIPRGNLSLYLKE